MKKEETRFTEQEAPYKNTDKAYVKVTREKDAQPDKQENIDKDRAEGGKGEPEKGTLRHR